MSNKRPTFNTYSKYYLWFELLGEDQELDNGPSYLPKAIYDKLRGYRTQGSNWKAYDFESQALVEYMRVLESCV